MPRCNQCGQFVTPAYARVFGSNEDELFACEACAPSREYIESGEAARAHS